MTTAERYVSTLCRDRIEELRHTRELAVKEARYAPRFATLPARVRQAVAAYQDAEIAMRRAERVLRAAGYYAPSQGHVLRRVDERSRLHQINKHFDARLATINRMKTQYGMAVLGMTPKEAKALLEKLTRELREVK